MLQELQLFSSQYWVLSIIKISRTHALAVLLRSSAGTLRRRWFVGNRLGFLLRLAASGSADDMVFKDYSPRRLPLSVVEELGKPRLQSGPWVLVINAILVLNRPAGRAGVLPRGLLYAPIATVVTLFYVSAPVGLKFYTKWCTAMVRRSMVEERVENCLVAKPTLRKTVWGEQHWEGAKRTFITKFTRAMTQNSGTDTAHRIHRNYSCSITLALFNSFIPPRMLLNGL